MSIKTIVVIAGVVALVAAGGWYFRDAEPMRDAADSVAGFAKSILPDNSYTVAKSDAEKSAGKTSQPLRKCVSESRTIYTDEKCPAGSREAQISEGNVTVVPGQRAVDKAKKSEEKAK